MIFISTRNKECRATFQDAIFQGLAPDGGLFVPLEHPSLSRVLQECSSVQSFPKFVSKIIYSLLSDELNWKQCEELSYKTFPFSPKLKKLPDSVWNEEKSETSKTNQSVNEREDSLSSKSITLLELFHGPSCAFKDFGASFLANSMELFLRKKNRHAIILTATSGDTGSAVAQAFYNKQNIDVVILYPSGRVSPLQEKQLTTLGGNIKALEIEGSFDDCQKLVKEAFMDKTLRKKLPLTSANSINLGRLLPQTFYYLYAKIMMGEKNLVFCVPSGNFGNLTAGLYAWKWGMDVKAFIAATNINDVVPEYLEQGVYNPKPSKRTLSNAMDVGDPSNFERMKDLFNNNWDEMKDLITGFRITDEETIAKMKEYYSDAGIFLDPHTAVGVSSSEKYLRRTQGPCHIVSLSTAHPGKFLEIVKKATGEDVSLPERLSKVLTLQKQSHVLGNTFREFSDFLLKTF